MDATHPKPIEREAHEKVMAQPVDVKTVNVAVSADGGESPDNFGRIEGAQH